MRREGKEGAGERGDVGIISDLQVEKGRMEGQISENP